MRSFDAAIVGAGGIAEIHASEIQKLGGRLRIAAVVEVDDERREKFAARWSVPHAYADLSELTEPVDLVHLCTPPALHYSQATACLSRGLTVLCEKPPALSLAEIDSIAAAGGHFATVSQHRFGSGAARLRRLVGDSRLGKALTAVCHTLWYRPDSYFEVPWRGSWESEGGGPTMGHGIHQMDLMLSVLGEWESVTAVAVRRARPTQTEDLSCAIVTFANGAVASVVNSLLSPRETSYLRFDFEHATVELQHLYGYADSDWSVTGAAAAAAWEEGPRGTPSGHAAQFSEVLDALEAGQPPPVSVAQARATLELIAAIYASSFTQRPVCRGEIGPESPFYRRMDGGFGVA